MGFPPFKFRNYNPIEYLRKSLESVGPCMKYAGGVLLSKGNIIAFRTKVREMWQDE